LGEYLISAGEPQRAFSSELQEAFSLAESSDNKDRAARACALATLGIVLHGAGASGSWTIPEAAQWVERADRYAKPDTRERVWANLGLGELKRTTGLLTGEYDMAKEGTRLIISNLDLARRINDAETFWFAATSYCLHVSAPHHAGKRLKFAEELSQRPRSGLTALACYLADAATGISLLEFGYLQRATAYFKDLKETAERSRQANLLIASMGMDSYLATFEGRLEEAVAIAENIYARGSQSGIAQYASAVAILSSFQSLFHLGRLDQIHQMFGDALHLSLPPFRANLGKKAEVIKILEQWVIGRPGIGTTDDETFANMDMLLLQAAVRIGHRQAAGLLLGRFAGSGMLIPIGMPTCIPRHLGAAAALLDRYEEARKYYDESLKVTTEMRFRPEIALTRLQLAELLLEHYPNEKAVAHDHLDFAIKEFREMKMQPSLDRALKHHQVC
jgi:tetratricopeptide (TPR) repeat protein